MLSFILNSELELEIIQTEVFHIWWLNFYMISRDFKNDSGLWVTGATDAGMTSLGVILKILIITQTYIIIIYLIIIRQPDNAHLVATKFVIVSHC